MKNIYKEFIKKQYETFKAVQLNEENCDDVLKWIRKTDPKINKKSYHELDAGMKWQGIYVYSIQGLQLAHSGDWIVNHGMDFKYFEVYNNDFFIKNFQPI